MKNSKVWVRENRWLNRLSLLGIASVCLFMTYFAKEIRNIWSNFYGQSWSYNGDTIFYGNTLYGNILDMLQYWYYIFLFGIGLITIVLFWDMKNQNTKEWIWSLPMKKKDIFWHKWFRGIVAYTIPLILFTAGTLILFSRNIGWIRITYAIDERWQSLFVTERPVMYIKAFLMMWLWGTVCYSIWFLMQIVCRKVMVAFLCGTGIISFTTYLIVVLSRINAVNAMDVVMEKTAFLRRMFVGIFEAGSETSWEYRALNYMNSGINIKTYKIQAVDLCVIAALTALCLVLAYRYFNRINDTYQEGIFTVKWIRYAILAGLGFCLGLGITSNIIYYHRKYSLMLVFAGTILITILFTFAADKLMKRRGY
jgi:hypothetical protein